MTQTLQLIRVGRRHGVRSHAEKNNSGILGVLWTGRRDLEGNKYMYIFMWRNTETTYLTLYGKSMLGAYGHFHSYALHSVNLMYNFYLSFIEKLFDPSSPYPHGLQNHDAS